MTNVVIVAVVVCVACFAAGWLVGRKWNGKVEAELRDDLARLRNMLR